MHNEQSTNHISLKNRPRCYTKSPTAQDTSPGLISCMYTDNCYSANHPLSLLWTHAQVHVQRVDFITCFNLSTNATTCSNTVQLTLHIYTGRHSSSILPTCTPILQFAYCVPPTKDMLIIFSTTNNIQHLSKGDRLVYSLI